MNQAGKLRNALVDQLKEAGVLTDARVERAMRAVPRHLFVPDVDLETAYANEAIPTKTVDGLTVSSISQPAMVAIMLEQLQPREGERILEIGAGTGYNAALLGELVGAGGFVTTVDIDDDIVADAQANLARAKVANVQAVCADGGFGYAPHAPYDATMATVGLWDIAPEWLAQVRDGGRLVAPLKLNGIQECVAFRRKGDLLVSYKVCRCGFILVRGETASPEGLVKLEGMRVFYDDPEVDAAALRKLLQTEPVTETIALEGKVLDRFMDYLGVRAQGITAITADAEKYGYVYANGVMVGETSLAIVTYPDFTQSPPNQVTVYGDTSALDYFKAVLDEWDARGRPTIDDAKITAGPLGSLPPNPNAILLQKRWMEYQIEI